MPGLARSGYFYPNRAVRDLLRSLEDLMGKNGLSAALNLSGMKQWIESYPPDNLERQVDFSEIASIHLALEDIYGLRGGRNFSRRAGWPAIEGLLTAVGALKTMEAIAGGPKPAAEKLSAGLAAMAATLSHASDQQTTVTPTAEGVTVRVQPCPHCWGRKASEPLCFAMLGALETAADKLIGAQAATVEETGCIATGGDSCQFVVRLAAAP